MVVQDRYSVTDKKLYPGWPLINGRLLRKLPEEYEHISEWFRRSDSATKVGKASGSADPTVTETTGLFFRHAGHRDKVVVDFHWNASDPWTMNSVSYDCASTGGGAILQVLTGHKDNAEFALAMCSTEFFVLSGGRDKHVVLWSIHYHVATLATEAGPNVNEGSNIRGNSEKAAESPSVGARGIYRGHKDTVEDVQFCPSSAQEFCSVGYDSYLILWDARVGSFPTVKVEKAHDGDVRCVFILTGSADNIVRMFDCRKLNNCGVGSSVYKFEGHDVPVLCVQWNPVKSSVFGTGAEDGIINIWDHEKVGKASGSVDPTVMK